MVARGSQTRAAASAEQDAECARARSILSGDKGCPSNRKAASSFRYGHLLAVGGRRTSARKEEGCLGAVRGVRVQPRYSVARPPISPGTGSMHSSAHCLSARRPSFGRVCAGMSVALTSTSIGIHNGGDPRPAVFPAYFSSMLFCYVRPI